MNHPSLSPHESPFGLPVAYTCQKNLQKGLFALVDDFEAMMTLVTRLVLKVPPHLLTLTDFQLSFYISDCTGNRALEEMSFKAIIGIQTLHCILYDCQSSKTA